MSILLKELLLIIESFEDVALPYKYPKSMNACCVQKRSINLITSKEIPPHDLTIRSFYSLGKRIAKCHPFRIASRFKMLYFNLINSRGDGKLICALVLSM